MGGRVCRQEDGDQVYMCTWVCVSEKESEKERKREDAKRKQTRGRGDDMVGDTKQVKGIRVRGGGGGVL